MTLFSSLLRPRAATPKPDARQSAEPLYQACCAALARHIARAIAAGLWQAHWPQPQLCLTQRGKAAGSAHLQRWEIRLNPVLLADNQQAFIEEVIPHELCHLLVFKRHGKTAPHGREWQALMQQLFALPGKATHNMDIQKVAGQQFIYRCGCREHPLSLRRHNNVLRGKSRYLCRHCGHPLTMAPKDPDETHAEQ